MNAAEFRASIETLLDQGDPEWAAAVRRGMAESRRDEMHPLTHDLAEADEMPDARWPLVPAPNPINQTDEE